jgi:hypothetical protein
MGATMIPRHWIVWGCLTRDASLMMALEGARYAYILDTASVLGST